MTEDRMCEIEALVAGAACEGALDIAVVVPTSQEVLIVMRHFDRSLAQKLSMTANMTFRPFHHDLFKVTFDFIVLAEDVEHTYTVRTLSSAVADALRTRLKVGGRLETV